MRIFEDFDLTEFNSYGIKARCKTAYFPENDNDIIHLFRDSSKSMHLIGGGYNIIFSKDYYDDEFVVFSGCYDKIQLVNDDSILCEAGCDMKKLSEFAMSKNLSGLEIFYDIPSSLGGAVVMNAGAGGEDIKALLVKVWYYNIHTQQIEEITKDQIGFEYRNSFFQKNPGMVICRALLKLQKGSSNDILQKMEYNKSVRWLKQPRNYPNAGSVFKRPNNHFVGPMIEQLGLKGLQLGGAKISEKHAGFIINYDNATGKDILALIQHVQKAVKDKFKLDLEIEQRII